MLVGDSIMRNQWESLVCLVQGVIPTGRKKVTYDGPTMAFHALVRFSWFDSRFVGLLKENGNRQQEKYEKKKHFYVETLNK